MLFRVCVLAVLVCLARGQLSWLFVGDWGTDSLAQRQVADAMDTWAGANNPSFILTAGDNFYDGVLPDDERWNTVWRDIYSGSNIANLPWYVSLGNHDYYPSGTGIEWNQVDYSNDPVRNADGKWNLPHLWHSFQRDSPLGQINFVCIDSQALRRNENDPTAQRDWFVEQLRRPANMTFVVAHHPSYTVGRHGPGSSTMRGLIADMEDNNVDMFITGHDHNLQFLNFIDDSRTLDFVVSGGGGRGLYDEEFLMRDILRDDYEVNVEQFLFTHGFLGFVVESNQVRIEFRDEGNDLLYTLNKRPKQRAVPV